MHDLLHYSSFKNNALLKILFLFLYLSVIAFITVSGSTKGMSTTDFSDTLILSLKFAQIINVVGVFIIPSLLFAFFLTDEKMYFLALHKKVSVQSLLLVALIMFCNIPLINMLSVLNNRMVLPDYLANMEQWMKTSEAQYAKLTEAFMMMNTTGDLLLNLFLIGFLAAFSEELFFRGILQKTFFQLTRNIHISILFTAIIFSAFHFQFYGFVPRMMLGILLGYLFRWSGSLWLPVAAHFTHNGTAVIFAFLYPDKKLDGFDIDKIGTENDNMTLIICTLLVSALLFFLYRRETKRIQTNILCP